MSIDSTILRQYGNSPKLKKIVYLIGDALNTDTLIDNFYNKIFNLDTATSNGLDMWGRIVNVSRYVNFSDYETGGDFFGFNGSNFKPFNNSPFYTAGLSTNTLRLSDDFYRKIIKAKAAVNISSATPSDMNRLLLSIFSERGQPFVVDNLDMTMNYIFPFYLTSGEIALIKSAGVISRPSGVKVRVIASDPKKTFGFYGSNCQPFNQGTFINSKGVFNVN